MMTNEPTAVEINQAQEHFRQAHMQALLQDWRAGISGRNTDLFSYEEVRKILEAREGATFYKTQDIPLDKIVGSVGRYRDFTSAFLPRNAALAQRWQRVDAAMSGLVGVPAVDLYQVGDVYFVRDGNHRVSVARSRGDKSIDAYVTKVDVPFPVEADSAEKLSTWLTEAGHRLFLKHTQLQTYYPDADIRLTEPGRYRKLYEQIDVHRWYLGEAFEREIPYEEAVRSWYDHVYLPLTESIRESGVLKEFPNRTVADLYLWICHHREELRKRYNLDLSENAAVSTFASVYSDKRMNKAIKGARLAVARIAAGEDVIIGLPKEDH
ncbi:MAG: transcriptional regulator [Chloroflexi bacterium]|nr:transcriptional regulator [Chloroflexota bacterium]